MGLCYSLRSRLAAAHPSAPYGSRGEPDTPAAAEHGDPQVRHRLRQDLVAKERADKKRSKSIDKTLKAEKREYKQTHRLLLLGLVLHSGHKMDVV
ncbi:guanine nucleotide-binding protein G(s) subunit alpha-like protein [Turdus rufiventris]|nr:guanine nucleotide-binding protein G(s) subunit alpha-like protein [Turdus rufiventris]